MWLYKQEKAKEGSTMHRDFRKIGRDLCPPKVGNLLIKERLVVQYAVCVPPRDRRLLYISYQPLPFVLGDDLEWSEIVAQGVGGNEETMRRRRRRRTLSGRLRQSYYLLLKLSQTTQRRLSENDPEIQPNTSDDN